MKINLHSPLEEVQIQIIPLIDVVFCILTFFLLAALQFTRQQAISVDLPKAATGTSSQAPAQGGREILPVTINADGGLFVEKQQVNREQLAQLIRAYRQQNPNGVLVLNASRSATYDNVVQLLDLLRQLGGDRVALATIPGSSEQPDNPTPATPIFPGTSGTVPLPNNVPIAPTNPSAIPNSNLPGGVNQFPAPTAPGQGINPGNPGGVAPVFPTTPQAPVAPAPVAPANSGQANPARR